MMSKPFLVIIELGWDLQRYSFRYNWAVRNVPANSVALCYAHQKICTSIAILKQDTNMLIWSIWEVMRWSYCPYCAKHSIIWGLTFGQVMRERWSVLNVKIQQDIHNFEKHFENIYWETVYTCQCCTSPNLVN